MMLSNKLYRFIVTVSVCANIAGAFILLILVLTMNFDVVSRGVFNAPFRGVVEFVVFAMILIVFLQLPDVVRTGRLTRSDGLLQVLKSTNPKRGVFLERFIDVVSCLFMCMIAWTVWPEVVESFESCHFYNAPEFGRPDTGNLYTDFMNGMDRCDYFGTPGILKAPWWPARLVMFFGSSFAAVIFFTKAFGERDAVFANEKGSKL
jgi:TRAP-type mannitol/chloroaromatic compound transport system permease small subunit